MSLRNERGLLWVDTDVECAAVLFEQVKSIDKHVLPYVTDFSVCVQGGGNCGLFPVDLARKFKFVITAEPDPDNFAALSANTAGIENISTFEAAWGESVGSIGLAVELGNCGATRVINEPGNASQLPIDIIGLSQCGLIYLDVEGFEEFALRGAEQTIKRCHPTIVVELKGLAHVYDRTDEDCERYLQQLGYRKVHRFDNDVVWR